MENLPKRTKKLRKGVVVHTMGSAYSDSEYLVYIGEPQALIDSKIAPPEILQCEERVDADRRLIWAHSVLTDGRYCFIDYVAAPERVGRQAAADPTGCLSDTAKALAKRHGMLLYAEGLKLAEQLARSIGPEGIAKRRLRLARDDSEFQAFLAKALPGQRADDSDEDDDSDEGDDWPAT